MKTLVFFTVALISGAQAQPRQMPTEHYIIIHDCPPESRPSGFVDPDTGFIFPLPQGR